MLHTMTQSTPVVGSIIAGSLGVVSGSWWMPLLIQLISLGVGYLQGKKVEVRKQNILNQLDAANANSEPHGGEPLPDEADQT